MYAVLILNVRKKDRIAHLAVYMILSSLTLFKRQGILSEIHDHLISNMATMAEKGHIHVYKCFWNIYLDDHFKYINRIIQNV